MLFRFDESVATLLNSGLATEKDCDGFRYILLGSIEGNHRLAGQRSTLLSLSKLEWLNNRERMVLERALGRVAQEGMISHRLKTIGQIVAGNLISPNVAFRGSQRLINFPLSWFDQSSKVQPVVLVGENLSDTRVLRIIAQVGMLLNEHGYVPVVFDPSSGGGSTTRQVVAHFISQQRLCICAVDSDKASPNSESGGTSKGVEEFRAESFPLVEILQTSGRELENYLPDAFFLESYGRHATYGLVSELLGRLTSADESQIRAHLDIKNGFGLCDIYRWPLDSPERQFWISKREALFALAGVRLETCPCHTESINRCERRSACECMATQGIRSNMLDDFCTYQSGRDVFAIKSSLDTSVRDEWTRLGSELGSWGCGDDRLRM